MYSSMNEAELFGYFNRNHQDILEVMAEERIEIKTIKNTLEKALEEENKRKGLLKGSEKITHLGL